MEILTLPPELERFAAEAVAAGRYRDFSDVVAAGIGMLLRTEDARAKLLQSVQAAERNGELNGFLTLDEVIEDADAVIAEMAGHAIREEGDDCRDLEGIKAVRDQTPRFTMRSI